MTQYVLCFGFEVAIKKCIITYLTDKYESENKIGNVKKLITRFGRNALKSNLFIAIFRIQRYK